MSRLLSRPLCCLLGALYLAFAPAAWAATAENNLPPARSFAGAYLAGRAATGNNDIEAAVSYLQRALLLEPDNQAIAQDLLFLLLGSGQFDAALLLAADLRDHDDVGRFSRLTLAAEAFSQRQLDKVRAELVAPDLDVMDRLVATLVSAWAAFGQGERRQAIDEIEALEGPPWYDPFRFYMLGLMYGLNEQDDEAHAAFETALGSREGGASAPDAYERIIIAYAAFKDARGDRGGAIDILQRGEELLSGRNVLTHLRETVSAGGAIALPVTTAQEGVAEALYAIGTALNRSGGEAYGRLYLNIALILRPDHDATLFQLAELANKIAAHDEAVAYYQWITPESPYFRDATIRLALTLADAKRAEEATALLGGLLAQYDDANLALTLSGIHMQQQNFAATVEALTPHIDKGQETPALWRLFYQRGIAHERLKEWDKAEPDFRAALRLFPNQPQVLNYLGYSLIDRNMKLEEALDMVVQAVALRPQDGYIVDSLGWAYYKLGRYEEAVVELEQAVKLRPEDPTINDHLGDAYWQVGRRLEATFQWKHAVDGKPEAEELVKIEAKLNNGLQDNASAE